jgi:hypothetical protein
MNPNENIFLNPPSFPPLIFNTEVNKISGNQGGLASNKFSANEVPAVEQTGALSFFSFSFSSSSSPFATFNLLKYSYYSKGGIKGGFEYNFIILQCMVKQQIPNNKSQKIK